MRRPRADSRLWAEAHVPTPAAAPGVRQPDVRTPRAAADSRGVRVPGRVASGRRAVSVELNAVERMTRVLLRLGIMPSDVMFDGMQVIVSSSGPVPVVELRIRLAPDAANRVIEVMADVGSNG